MATAIFDRKELDTLVGKKIDDETFRNNVPMMGIPIERLTSDEIEIEVFPNHPELFSIEGFARLLRCFIYLEKPKEFTTKPSGITLNIEKVHLRPYIVAAVVKNIKVTDGLIKSLMQFQEKLHLTMGRKREKIAIGVHDLDKVQAPFTYKSVKPEDIGFIPLGAEDDMNLADILTKHPKGKEFAHLVLKSKEYPILTDKNNHVLSFPPIINGELTKVTTNTKNIFIDITGTNEFYLQQALNLTATIFAERGAEIQTVKVNGVDYPNLQNQKMKIDMNYVNRLLDLDLSLSDLKPILNKMGLDISKDEVLVPPYRTDILHQMDIVEDIAIGFGYDKVEAKIPKVPTIAFREEKEEYANKVREILVGMGFQEIISSVLTNPESHYTKMNTNKEESCEIENPATQDYTICRKGLLQSLVKTFTENQHRTYPQLIFEIGDVVESDGKQRTKLAVGIANPIINYEELSSRLNGLLKNLGVSFTIESSAHFSLLPGRTGKILVKGKEVGIIGELNPRVLEHWNLDNPAAAFEIELERIINEI